MRIRIVPVMAGCLAVALLLATGCVGKGTYRKNTEQMGARIDSVESAVEANERRVADLKSETDKKVGELRSQTDKALQSSNQAMDMARSASQKADAAASGKLLWSVKLTSDQVKFGFNQSGLPGEAKAVLDDLVRQIKGYGKAVYLEIEGHTDNVGSEKYNHDLGLMRAEAVRDYLRKTGGIPLHAMNVMSYGESQPEADNKTRDGRARNRRVVVRVLE